MYRYKSLLVSLRGDDHDDRLIDYAELVTYMARSGRVRFVQVVPEATGLADLYPEALPALHAAAAEMHEALRARIARRFDGPWHTAVHCDLTEGARLPELLRLAREGAFDLLVVGKDAEGDTLAEKLARKAPCSVLVVPRAAPATIERVLVPVDFSAHAADAADVAVAFAEAAGLDRLHFLHVYTVPTGYLPARQREVDLAHTLRQRAEARACAFVEQLDLRGLTPEVHLDEAAALDADLVMVGTRGRSPSAAILLGSVAEQVVRAAPVPVVAVKRKGATLRLLDALFERHVAGQT